MVHTGSSLALVPIGWRFIVSPASRQQEVNILAADVKKWVEKQQQQKHLTMQKTMYFHSAINKTLWSNCFLSVSLCSPAGSWVDLL